MGEVDYDNKLINDEYFCSQYFIFKTIHEYVREEYWKISKRNIKLKTNLLNRPLHWCKIFKQTQ